MCKVIFILALCAIGQSCKSTGGSSVMDGSGKAGDLASVFVLNDDTAAALYPVLAIEETNTAVAFAGGGRQLAKVVKELKCTHLKQFNETTGGYNEDFSCLIDATALAEISQENETITITGPTAQAIYDVMNVEAETLPIVFQGGGIKLEKKAGNFACTFLDTYDESVGKDLKVYDCSFPDKRM